MGRTLPSITQAFLHEQQSLGRFRRALRLEDQRALDDLLAAARQHLAAAAYASHLLPFEVMLLAMLVEEHKRVLHLEVELARVHQLLDRTQQASGETAIARWRDDPQSSSPRDGSVIGPPAESGGEETEELATDPNHERRDRRARRGDSPRTAPGNDAPDSERADDSGEESPRPKGSPAEEEAGPPAEQPDARR